MIQSASYGEATPRILFVDDERKILDAYALLLGDFGYQVQTAANTEEACDWLVRQQSEIAFIDYYLGKELGVDIMERLAGISPETSFVIITGNGTTEMAVDVMKRGAADFISKPFTGADLVKSIEYVRKKRDLEFQRRQMINGLENAVNRKTKELRRLFYEVLSSFAQAMEKRDIGTYGHCRRVSQYAVLIAAVLGLGEEERNTLKAAAVLHDVGKIGISDFVIGKAGPLSDDEWSIIREHPERGVSILRPIKQFAPILPGILHHHESFDGSGYPEGLAGDDIPLDARIISIADAYDAILSKRPYREAANREQAINELASCAGTQFDPDIVHSFVAADTRFHSMFGDCQEW